MMDYEVFKNVVMARIKEFLPSVYSEFEVTTVHAPKINGMREAMVVSFESGSCCMAGPNIYFDDLYEVFSECGDLEDVLEQVAVIIMEYTGTQNFDKNNDMKLSDYKEYIVQMLINTEMNKELLKLAPHKEFFDLSLIYRLAVPNMEGDGYSTALITEDMMREMGLTVDELDKLAEENSRRNLPTQLFRMGPYLTMMTTEPKMYGGINLMRTDEIRKISDEMKGSLYILPSSVHDLMALKAEGSHMEMGLFEMLKNGNEKCNSVEENLSYNIYYYDRESHTLEIRYCNS